MKNVRIKWSNLAFNLIVALVVALITGWNPVYCAAAAVGTGVALGFVKNDIAGLATMAIQKEIWEADIVGNLYKDNQFLQYAFNADMYVNNGKTVHIPNAGSAPDVTKNRTSLPATVTTRTDVDITYDLDEYTSDPIRIPHADTVELSYDKRQSVTSEAQDNLRQVVAENMLVKWAPATAQVIKTTGEATAATAPSATGNRKLITLADLKAAMIKMNKDDVPLSDRYAVFSAELYGQLIDSMSATQYKDFSQYFDASKGIVGQLYGFNILQRSTALIYDTSFAVKAVGAAGAATDNEGALLWQKNSVERALGEVVFFEDQGNPTYYADIYSFLVRMGGRIRRNDKKGVLAIVQNTAS